MTPPFARRRITVAAAALALVLSGCSASTSVAGPDTADADSIPLLPAPEGTTVYPLTLDTAWGEVTLEERPERLAAVESTDFALLVALGVTPVASHDDEDAYVPWSDEVLVQEAVTWPWSEVAVPPELIAKADVDLTVATNWGTTPFDNIEQLESVAPVLPQPDLGDVTPGWRDKLLMLGEALDLSERAAGLIDDYDAQLSAFRDEHPEFAGKTVAALEFWEADEAVYSSLPGGMLETMLVDMGFATNPDAERFAEVNSISGELVGDIAADIVIAFDYAATREEFAAWIDSPLFQQIDAVENGALVAFTYHDRLTLTQDGEVIATVGQTPMVFSDPIGTPRFAEAIAPYLSDALAG